MGRPRVKIWLSVLVSALTLAAWVNSASATSTERGSSVLIFPKVIFDPTAILGDYPTDTLIQISNTSNSLVHAHCHYINAAPGRPDLPVSEENPPQWEEINFDIFLTKQQPTHWVVGLGRTQDPSDPICASDPQLNTVTNRDCVNAGFDPGRIPLTPQPFIGELRCVEVDSSGAPINGNHLKGEATIVRQVPGAVGTRWESSKYNAIGLHGLNDIYSNNSDFTLCIGGGVRPGCPTGPEYAACPQRLLLNHYAVEAEDPIIDSLSGDSGPVTTEVTIVPCSQDLERLERTIVTLQFRIINEFEELYSASTTVDCWRTFSLEDVAFNIFDEAVLGSRFVQTQISTPAEQSGILGVVEEYHRQGTLVSTGARDIPFDGERVNGDIMAIPEGR